MRRMNELPIGFKIIKEMTREELIGEILDNQRAAAEELDLSTLRHHVADFRIAEMTKRIHKEAGLKQVPGPFGMGVISEDKDNE
jgi:hypothetical protein